MVMLVLCILLMGCTKEDEKDLTIPLQSEPIYFVVGEHTVFEMYVPGDCELLYTDCSTYYEFTDGTKIMVTHTPIHTTEQYDTDLGVYYSGTGASRDVADSCVTIRCEKERAAAFKLLLSDGIENRVISVMRTDNKLESMESRYLNKQDDMHITNNGNYMPKDELTSINGQYTADLVAHGTSWCKCWVQDGIFDDIQKIADTYIACADKQKPDAKWYQSPNKDLLFIQTPTGIFAAKALHYNSWAIYYTSVDFADYVRTALDIIHAK